MTAAPDQPQRPLAGIKVLEMGALVAAPYCGMLLADLGAEVIKLEPPAGDMARGFAPFVAGESAFFMSVNRSKQSVCLDLTKPEAQEVAHQLAASVDVVIHNFRTGVAERLGLGYDDIASANPSVVYCAVSGFGPRGPMAERAGIDLLFQAESGMMAITGEAGGEPVKAGTNAADVYGATTAAVGILAALVARAVTGRGRLVEVAARDAFFALQACWVASYFATGEQPERLGAGSPFSAPTDVYPTGDGSIVLAVVNAKHWRVLCDVLELEIVDDPRFGSNESRVAHTEHLRELVSVALRKRTTSEWLEIFSRARIPYGQVLTYDGVAADEQIQYNDMIITVQHPTAGPVRMPGIPLWLDRKKRTGIAPPPRLGEHTQAILTKLGLPPDLIARLAA